MRQTQEQLDKALAYWQKQLRLQDWKIEARFVRRWELSENNHTANVTYREDHKVASVEIGVPGDYPNERVAGIGDFDWERHLVHELLHLHLWPWQPEAGAIYDILQEQAINVLADAFISLARCYRLNAGDNA